MKKKYIFFMLVSLQILVIGILFREIQRRQVLGSVSINAIKSDTIIATKTGALKYFYEPKPNTIDKPEVIFPGLENVSYHINNTGFHQLNDYQTEKKDGVYRIIAIGDSFTFGSKVNTADNYPSQLENMLNEKLSCPTIQKFEVLNLGVGGYDIQYTVKRLQLRGIQYNPNLVIWLLIPDDFTRLDEVFIPRFKQHLNETEKNGEYKNLIENGTYDTEWNRAKNEAITEVGGYDTVFSMQKEYIEDISTFYSGTLLFSLLPTPYDKDTDRTIYTNLLYEFSQRRSNTFFYDTLPRIYDIPDAALPDNHPSKKGHALLADSFMKYLVRERILPCSLK